MLNDSHRNSSRRFTHEQAVRQTKLELAQHLNAMLIEYWHDVDTNEGRNAASYYTEDTVFEGSRSNSRTRSSSFLTSELPTTGSSESTAAAPPSLKSRRHR